LLGVVEPLGVLFELEDFLAFLVCFLVAGLLVEGWLGEGAGAGALACAKDRTAAKAVPNIKAVMRFIVVFSSLGRFVRPHYVRRGW
jgi:hypothetical protein